LLAQQQAVLQALGFSSEALEHHTDTSSLANVRGPASDSDYPKGLRTWCLRMALVLHVQAQHLVNGNKAETSTTADSGDKVSLGWHT
jgi:hypothetical protein